MRRAGPAGISGDDLYRIVFDGQLPRYVGGRAGRDGGRSRQVLKSNVYQLNQELAATGSRIVGSRCRGGWYWLRKGG